MNPISAIAIYFVIWWTTLFVVLPFWVRNASEAKEAVEGGNEPGAPVQAHMGRKALVTTAIATVVFLAVYWMLTQSYFNVLDLPFFGGAPQP
jgi:predicted secreted protein